MRPALLCLLLAALSWPALARQDQSQTPPATTPPPPAQGPSTSTPPATTPPPPSQAPAQPSAPAGAQRAPATEAPPASAKTTKKKVAKKKKTAKKKLVAKHKKAAPEKQAETSPDGPHRIVVRRGGTSDTGGQLEPGVPESQADHQRQATEQLLQSTDASLKKIAQRQLTPDQQDMVRQITSYIQQSRSANQEGDLGRARNLAVKAHQLCDALARQ